MSTIRPISHITNQTLDGVKEGSDIIASKHVRPIDSALASSKQEAVMPEGDEDPKGTEKKEPLTEASTKLPFKQHDEKQMHMFKKQMAHKIALAVNDAKGDKEKKKEATRLAKEIIKLAQNTFGKHYAFRDTFCDNIIYFDTFTKALIWQLYVATGKTVKLPQVTESVTSPKSTVRAEMYRNNKVLYDTFFEQRIAAAKRVFPALKQLAEEYITNGKEFKEFFEQEKDNLEGRGFLFLPWIIKLVTAWSLEEWLKVHIDDYDQVADLYNTFLKMNESKFIEEAVSAKYYKGEQAAPSKLFIDILQIDSGVENMNYLLYGYTGTNAVTEILNENKQAKVSTMEELKEANRKDSMIPMSKHEKFGISQLRDGLTMEMLERRFKWVLEAKTRNAVLGISQNSDSNKISLVWYSGDWEGGEWKDGTWMSGTWHRGTWNKGTWVNGKWHKGDWINGEWQFGVWYSGHWYNGTWKNGLWVKGKWHNGLHQLGSWENGIWIKGTWAGGTWKSGLWNNGLWQQGTWEQGTWKSGKWKAGSWKAGKWGKGSVYDSSKDKFVHIKINPMEYYKTVEHLDAEEEE